MGDPIRLVAFGAYFRCAALRTLPSIAAAAFGLLASLGSTAGACVVVTLGSTLASGASIVPVSAAILASTVVLPAAVPASGSSAPVFTYEVVDVFPHDPDAFTQGLILKDGYFYESTGLYGASTVRKVEVGTGAVLLQYDLPASVFGEGLTALGDTLYQLTFQNQEGYAYLEQDSSFQLVETFDHPWSGWGLTHDGSSLIVTDGSSTVRYLDPTTKELLREFVVRDDGVPINRLNELEYIDGRIFANIWLTERIAIFDADTGVVEAWLDLGGLADSVSFDPGVDVLNGIAWNPETNHLYVTGKWWPKLFEIEMPPLDPAGIDETPSEAGPTGAADPRDGAPIPVEAVPNPAGGGTELRFVLPETSVVGLRVFDARGRLVVEGVRLTLPRGPQQMPLDTRSLAVGAYFLQLTTHRGTSTATLQVVR